MGLTSKHLGVILITFLTSCFLVGLHYNQRVQIMEEKLRPEIVSTEKRNSKMVENIETRMKNYSFIRRKLKVKSDTETSIAAEQMQIDRILMCNEVVQVSPTKNTKLDTQSPPNTCITPKTRVAFVKTHKTAGTTIENILQRFGFLRNLTFVMPFKDLNRDRYNYIGEVGESITPQNIIPKLEEEEYDILCNHVIYNEASFKDILPHDTFRFTIIREPFAQFMSTIDYYGYAQNGFLAQISGQELGNPLTVYLESPWKYEAGDPLYSLTNNRMSLDLGVPSSQLRNMGFLTPYFENLAKSLNLVLLQEYFDESLILFKRHACWSFKDILYARHNVFPTEHKINLVVTVRDINLHRNWNLADYVLYETFHKIFWDKVAKEKDFFEEVFHFKKIHKKVSVFCSGAQATDTLTIMDSKWSPSFVLTTEDCGFINMGESEFITFIHTRMMSRVFPNGYVFP